MNRIETKILNCFAVKEAEKNMVFAARLEAYDWSALLPQKY